MPKAVALTPDIMAAPQPSPQAATAPRASTAPEPVQKLDHVPLQIRLPRDQARAIRVAAAERDQTISEFMLACFHASMKS